MLVLGHTRCGAVTASVEVSCNNTTALQATGCEHLDSIVTTIQESIVSQECQSILVAPPEEKAQYIDGVSCRNVLQTVELIRQRSSVLRRLEEEGRIAIEGAMYDVGTGQIRLLTDEAAVKNAE